MASRLPRELLNTVMDYLETEADNDDQLSRSLRAASLVCRSFVDPSQSRLFATISLIAPPLKTDAFEGCKPPRIFIPTNSKRGFKSSIQAFSRVISASPHLLGYVRCLNLHGSPHPLQPPLPPDHRDWLASQSVHLMTFLPNLAPILTSFGMYAVDWNKLLPEVSATINIILKSELLTSLTLQYTTNLPIPLLASCTHLQHLNLWDGGHSPPVTWEDSALTLPMSNHQKSQLISLKLLAPDSLIDWFSTEHCIFDISHLRHLVVLRGHHDLTKIFQTCSSSLESFDMPAGYLGFSQQDFDAVNIGSLIKLRKARFHISLTNRSLLLARNSLRWVNALLKRQSQMLAFEEIILDCFIIWENFHLDLSHFSETDSILAQGENLPALRSVNILVRCDKTRYTLIAIETIRMRLPLLHDMGIVRVIQL